METVFFPLPDEDMYVAYFPDAVQYRRVTGREKELIEAITRGMSSNEVCTQYGIMQEDYQTIHALLSEKLGFSDLENTGYISRLTINLTNNCNLACRYCYAHGGSYECKSDFMSVETAKTVIDRFAANFRNIYMIQFFGGEPLMNPDTLEFLCSYICQMSAEGKLNPGLNERPRMVLMTNFSLLDDRTLEIIIKYGVNVTVSIDGSDEINHITRPMKNGKSHAKIVEENIRRLRAATNGKQPQLIEATYTALHREAGITVYDLLRYFKDEQGMERVHLLPAMVPEFSDCRIDDYHFLTEAAEQILEEHKNGKNYSFDKLEDNFVRLKYRQKPRRYVCDAGQSQFSVSTDGDVYPCYALAGDASLIMCNVHDEDCFQSDTYMSKRSYYAEQDRMKCEPCVNCFGRMMCHGCMAIYKSLDGDMFRPAETVCKTFCDILRLTLVYLAQNEPDHCRLGILEE